LVDLAFGDGGVSFHPKGAIRFRPNGATLKC
jgi:hypothetical protein